jgi:hypothetical protein
LLRRIGNNNNIGKPVITNQKICVLKTEIFSISLVSSHIHVSEIIDTNGKAIIMAAIRVDLLDISIAKSIIKADIKVFTICNVENIEIKSQN